MSSQADPWQHHGAQKPPKRLNAAPPQPPELPRDQRRRAVRGIIAAARQKYKPTR